MSWRAQVNGVLGKAGYRLVRSNAKASTKAATSRRSGTKPAALQGRTLPADYPPEMDEIWAAVKSRTMTGHNKVNYFCDAVRYVETHQIPGAIVECGVWRGGAMMAAATMLDLLGQHERDLYLFDTFAGMPEAGEHDVHIWHDSPADELLASRSQGPPLWQPATLDDVKHGMESVAYPAERVHYVAGMVEDTVPAEAPEQIAILRLDTDWYESTKHELEQLYSRLSPGGVLIIDDYGSWQGSKQATDEFLAATGEPLMLARIGRGRAAIKPGLQSRV